MIFNLFTLVFIIFSVFLHYFVAAVAAFNIVIAVGVVVVVGVGDANTIIHSKYANEMVDLSKV